MMWTEDLIDRIDGLGPGELAPVLDAVLERYRELFPDWEIIYAAIPKEASPERTAFLEALRERLQTYT